YLSVGNRISILHLEQQDEKDLVDRHLCNARRDWHHHGDVSVLARHDCPQRGGVRSGTHSLGAVQNQRTAPESCFVKIDLDGRECGQSRSCPTQAFCSRPTCLPKITAPGNVFQPVNPQDWPAVLAPDVQLEIGDVLLIDVAGYSKLVREEKQP